MAKRLQHGAAIVPAHPGDLLHIGRWGLWSDGNRWNIWWFWRSFFTNGAVLVKCHSSANRSCASTWVRKSPDRIWDKMNDSTVDPVPAKRLDEDNNEPHGRRASANCCCCAEPPERVGGLSWWRRTSKLAASSWYADWFGAKYVHNEIPRRWNTGKEEKSHHLIQSSKRRDYGLLRMWIQLDKRNPKSSGNQYNWC